MLFETKFAKERKGVQGQDFARRSVRIERQSDGHETAHEVRIAVAAIMKHGLARRIRAFAQFEPDLTDAAANLVRVIMRGLGERFERAAEFENIAIAIFPVVEEDKIAPNRIKTCQGGVPRVRIALLYIGMQALRARASRAESGAGLALSAAPGRCEIGGAQRIGRARRGPALAVAAQN